MQGLCDLKLATCKVSCRILKTILIKANTLPARCWNYLLLDSTRLCFSLFSMWKAVLDQVKELEKLIADEPSQEVANRGCEVFARLDCDWG